MNAIRTAAAAAAIFIAASGSARPQESSSIISGVTVFPDRAAVTRTIELALQAGPNTVTVVDLPSGEVLAGRTDTVGGRVFDAAIREHQLGTNGVWLPDDPATVTEFDAQCREAKEQLSASDAVAVPGAAGLILMSRDTFDPLIAQCVESSARFVRDIVERFRAQTPVFSQAEIHPRVRLRTVGSI